MISRNARTQIRIVGLICIAVVVIASASLISKSPHEVAGVLPFLLVVLCGEVWVTYRSFRGARIVLSGDVARVQTIVRRFQIRRKDILDVEIGHKFRGAVNMAMPCFSLNGGHKKWLTDFSVPVGKESRSFIQVGQESWTLNHMVEEIRIWIGTVHSAIWTIAETTPTESSLAYGSFPPSSTIGVIGASSVYLPGPTTLKDDEDPTPTATICSMSAEQPGISGGTINVYRTKGYSMDRNRKYKIFVDGKQVGILPPSRGGTYPVQAGEHVVRIHIDILRSNPVSVTIEPGANVQFVCLARPGPALLNTFMRPRSFLDLKIVTTEELATIRAKGNRWF
jgi:hypothetical protein